MSKILSFKQIQSRKYANRQDFQVASEILQEGLTELQDQNIIQGATNYGSFLENRHTELSDIDAVILNQNPLELISSHIWQQIMQSFQNYQIDFSPVIISAEDISTKRASFSFMQPLKHNTKRWHIGLDPVSLYFDHYSSPDQIRSLTVVISDYNRQFIEPLIYHSSLVHNPDPAQTAQLLLSGFKDSYRNLINIHSIQNQLEIQNSDLSFDNFQKLFPSLMSTFEYKLLDHVNTFQSEYHRRIQYYIANQSTFDQELEYNQFLESLIVMAPLVIKFIKQVRAQVLNASTQLILSS